MVPSYLAKSSLCIVDMLPFLTGSWVPAVGQKTLPNFIHDKIVVHLPLNDNNNNNNNNNNKF